MESGIKITYPTTNKIGAKVIDPWERKIKPKMIVTTPVKNRI